MSPGQVTETAKPSGPLLHTAHPPGPWCSPTWAPCLFPLHVGVLGCQHPARMPAPPS